MKGKPKIGLALGAGATRGFAHIGVLQVMEELGIRPDFIAGSSIGAIIGALYAAGVSPKMMEGIAYNLEPGLCYDLCVPRKGFIQGNKLENLIRMLTRNKDFEELDIPLAVTAVDLITSERVILRTGNVARAVRASISIPGVFKPVYDGDRVLVDGGILERVPVNVVREMGSDIVIGVDVGFRGKHRTTSNILEIILQSFEVMELEIIRHTVPDNAIMIYPNINVQNPLGFDHVEETIKAGRKAALDVLQSSRKLPRALQVPV
ncbi:MAG TPA: patatin-like phospholipase family protein [Candidatus Atribacteria bacterium]|nr:patatin-like phospholipase family protein [Candidatus Atribacteria bacterium]HPT77809.1 patatin-like phospholipase family protein [Candidatus Atribacteria bacterium]